jgi:Cu(I)/Ag(I) efflux system membrane fusion protein
MRTPLRAVAVAALILLVAIGWWFAGGKPSPHPGADAARSDREVLYWYDPMHPDQHFDAPGKSPFMDMQLVPKYASERAGGDTTVHVSDQMAQNLGMRTEPVVRGDLADRIEASGRIEADERSLRKVAVRAAGWLEVLNVRAEGDPVKQGQTLAEVYSPALDAAQHEFLLALESGQPSLLDASRDKLRALGFEAADIARLERDRRATRRIAVRAPIHGYVMKLSTREGAAVTPDAPLFELVGHDPLWVLVNLPESQSASIALDSAVQVRAEAYPGQTFNGSIDYLYPELDMGTRTRRARVVLENPNDTLHPGMFVDVSLSARSQNGVLLVPSEAVIRTGQRDVVIVAAERGEYRPAEVVVGSERDGRTVIVSGLDEGDIVVTSGQFLIDSEASLRGAYNRMQEGNSSQGSGRMQEGHHDHGGTP